MVHIKYIDGKPKRKITFSAAFGLQEIELWFYLESIIARLF